MNEESNEVPTEPTLEWRTRRQFTSAEKVRLLGGHDELARGEKGALLRRKGLYGAQLAGWRKTLSEQGSQGLEPKAGGRKAKGPRDRRIEELEREKARLEHRARVAEDQVDLQKMYGAPL